MSACKRIRLGKSMFLFLSMRLVASYVCCWKGQWDKIMLPYKTDTFALSLKTNVGSSKIFSYETFF